MLRCEQGKSRPGLNDSQLPSSHAWPGLSRLFEIYKMAARMCCMRLHPCTANHGVSRGPIVKPTASVCAQIVRDMLDDDSAKKMCDSYIIERATRGLRSLGVAKSTNNGSSWRLVGLISLLDPPREDSMATIRIAQGMGVQVPSMYSQAPFLGVESRLL